MEGSTSDMLESALGTRAVRSVYLLTYSQADELLVDSRESFGDCVKGAFQSIGATVIQWACSQERHEDGACTTICV